MIKKLVAAVLALLCVFAVMPFSFAQEAETKLYTFYGDGMLFKQNEEAVISGTGKPNCIITAELIAPNGITVEVTRSQIKADGTFSISFTAPAGSYDQYKIVLKADGVEFETLNDVVFGEQWLASGQSNMEYHLGQAKGGLDMLKAEQKLDKWLRVLLVPPIPEYKGSDSLVPVEPQKDIPGAKWVTGENIDIYNMSAVAYYFAAEMRKELDMPVGILNIPLGGTSIDVWLSREAIDSDAQFKSQLVSEGKYIEKSDWNESKVNVYKAMTANYNLKVEALKNFKLSGMVWYQGESNLQLHESVDRYAIAFDLMQRSYTELFGYENGLLPIIYTQLASYYYSDDGLYLSDMNILFAEMQKQRPESRAMVSITDVPLTYLPEIGDIHPECKQEVGERMAFAAKGLVYGKYDNYTAASVKSVRCADSSIYVTFENVGDGIASKGNELQCFAVCGSDGVYVKANAEIIGRDTVRIWNDDIAQPLSATYAYCVNNQSVNLYSTHDGELLMPVSQFVTDKTVGKHYWIEKTWAECDSDTIWHNDNSRYTNFFTAWSAEDAEISINGQHAYSGNGGLGITSDNGSFSVSPVTGYKKNGIMQYFRDFDKDFSDYGKLTVRVRNNGNSDVSLDSLRFYKNSFIWYAPVTAGTGENQAVIPADGQWHTVTLDLNTLYLFGNKCGLTYPCGRLDGVRNIKLVFSAQGSSSISVDEFRFAPSDGDAGIRYDATVEDADNVIEFVSAVAVTVLGFFAKMFS